MLDYSIFPNPILTFDLGLRPDMKICRSFGLWIIILILCFWFEIKTFSCWRTESLNCLISDSDLALLVQHINVELISLKEKFWMWLVAEDGLIVFTSCFQAPQPALQTQSAAGTKTVQTEQWTIHIWTIFKSALCPTIWSAGLVMALRDLGVLRVSYWTNLTK